MLLDDGYDVAICQNLIDVASRIDDHTGAVLLTEESLFGDRARLDAVLEAQQPWSDVPFIVLTDRRRGPRLDGDPAIPSLPPSATNVVTLERPLGSASLISAVASALRSRQKQFEMRNRLEELRVGKAALEASERRLDAIVNSIDQMIWSTRPDGFHDYYNDRWYDYTGVPPGSTDGDGWNGMFHEDDRERARATWRRSLDTGEPYHIEYRLRHRSGQYRWVLGRAQPERDADGRIVRWYGTCTDIQDIVEAREVLSRSREELESMIAQRTAELERAHDTLRQSQKMEAVGQLTGGIAHDFNNMLTGVIGGIDIVRRRLAAGRTDGLERFMDAAAQSAQRAAALTARLLAFSRRQTLDSRPIDVNALIEALDELLTRTLSESVSLEVALAAELPAAMADANQLENALLNLALNGRDAMPDGGTLTIATDIVELTTDDAPAADGCAAGRYVVVSVSDTGIGMTPEVLDKVYEPFFTTKPIGQGTGLGLSMVYGFARQSGGAVRIETRVGEGTTVRILLPAADARATDEAGEAHAAPGGDGQAVLIVEDDESVRLLVHEVLSDLGYSPIDVPDAPEAIRVLSSDRPIELMITDVGLPGMNGRQLADFARDRRPDLPILFVTGYAANAATHGGFVGARMAMITKPFALDVACRQDRRDARRLGAPRALIVSRTSRCRRARRAAPRSSRGGSSTARDTCGAAHVPGCRAADARRCSATGCTRAASRRPSAPASRSAASGCAASRPAAAATAAPATARRRSRSACGTDRSAAARASRGRRRRPRASRPSPAAGSRRADAAAAAGSACAGRTSARTSTASPAPRRAGTARS